MLKYWVTNGINDSFSILHTMAYTFIALQELVLFNNYPSIYWNTATLTVNSGSIEEEEVVLEDGEEQVLSKTRATDYGKVASAIGDLQQRDVTIALPLINQANYSFTPDEENNRIIFGFRGILGIGDDVANTIVNLRPYTSFLDFFERTTNIDEDDEDNVKIQNAKIITLIKAGAFDELESGKTRQELMMEYLRLTNTPKTNLNMQNWASIRKYQMIPKKLNREERMVNFKDYVLEQRNFVKQDEQFKSKKIYKLQGDSEAMNSITNDFFERHYMGLMEEDKHYWYNEDGVIEFYDSDMRRLTNTAIQDLRDWLNTEEALEVYNDNMYQELWEQWSPGSISRWEMDSVCFYSHDHELAHIDMEANGVTNFFDLPEEAEVVGGYKWRGRWWDEYAIHRLVGTVLDRDNTKHTVSLLTPTGVVTLKMYAGNFAHYNQQITRNIVEKGETRKQIVEPSWFTRGTLLSVVGFRRGATFIPKKYHTSIYSHTIEKIVDVDEDGNMTIQSERKRVD